MLTSSKHFNISALTVSQHGGLSERILSFSKTTQFQNRSLDLALPSMEEQLLRENILKHADESVKIDTNVIAVKSQLEFAMILNF